MTDYVMEAKHVYKTYKIKGEKKGETKFVEAAKDVSLQIRKGDIKLTDSGDGLVCDNCKLLYPIRDDIPIMLIDEAIPIGK